MPVIFENVPNLTFANKLSFLARVTITTRGGRLTSLDASFMRCFGFFKHRQKHRGQCFFQNIAETSHR